MENCDLSKFTNETDLHCNICGDKLKARTLKKYKGICGSCNKKNINIKTLDKGYCLKCKKNIKIKTIEKYKGICKVCDTQINKIAVNVQVNNIFKSGKSDNEKTTIELQKDLINLQTQISLLQTTIQSQPQYPNILNYPVPPQHIFVPPVLNQNIPVPNTPISNIPVSNIPVPNTSNTPVQPQNLCDKCNKSFSIKTLKKDTNGNNVCGKCSSEKKKVPIRLRTEVWRECVGNTLDGKCYCCKREIHFDSFECGHITSLHQGGKTIKENLKPICMLCNRSMGTMNLEEFKKSLE
jgi:hypothetical protein